MLVNKFIDSGRDNFNIAIQNYRLNPNQQDLDLIVNQLYPLLVKAANTRRLKNSNSFDFEFTDVILDMTKHCLNNPKVEPQGLSAYLKSFIYKVNVDRKLKNSNFNDTTIKVDPQFIRRPVEDSVLQHEIWRSQLTTTAQRIFDLMSEGFLTERQVILEFKSRFNIKLSSKTFNENKQNISQIVQQ